MAATPPRMEAFPSEPPRALPRLPADGKSHKCPDHREGAPLKCRRKSGKYARITVKERPFRAAASRGNNSRITVKERPFRAAASRGKFPDHREGAALQGRASQAKPTRALAPVVVLPRGRNTVSPSPTAAKAYPATLALAAAPPAERRPWLAFSGAANPGISPDPQGQLLHPASKLQTDNPCSDWSSHRQSG